MLNDHRFPHRIPALNMLNHRLITHNSSVQQVLYCVKYTWRGFSSNQTQASLQLIVQGLLVSSFESWLASENIDCAPLKLESCPFVSVPLSKGAQYTKDLCSVPELSHMLWFQAWLNLIKANTTGSFSSPRRKQLFIWRPCAWY